MTNITVVISAGELSALPAKYQYISDLLNHLANGGYDILSVNDENLKVPSYPPGVRG